MISPTRGPGGKLAGRPQVALDLHYLLAFYGSTQTLEPERMLGAVARNLHARPLLSRQLIQDAFTNHPELVDSNLVEAIERVRFTPAAISLDELSKLWSVFFQTPHALSMVYTASVVVIEAEESGPSALPVLSRSEQDRGVESEPDSQSPFPALASIHIGIPADAGAEPRPRSYPAAQLGAYLIFTGNHFSGDTVQVEFRHLRFSEPTHPQFLAPITLTVPATDHSVTEIRAAISDDADAQTAWRAGPYTVSVILTRDGKPQATNALSLLLAPKITGISPSNTLIRDEYGNAMLTLTASPLVPISQTATLLLADREITAEPRTADSDPLQFTITDAPVVTDAVVRLRVDGVDSIPFERTATPPGFQFAASQKVTIT